MEEYFDDDNEYSDECNYEDGDYSENEYNYGDDDSDSVESIACKAYTVLPESEIRRRIEELISSVCSTLNISKQKASKLLYHYKWEYSLVVDEWYADEAKVRAKTGLLCDTNDKTLLDMNEETESMCMICFELFPCDDSHFYRSDCGHVYCVNCWNGYITTSINDGPGCLLLQCPEPGCKASICQDVVDKLVGSVEKDRYEYFLFRSFIDGSKKVKWCPAPGCENAVEFELGSEVFDVICLCNNAFCWNCVEEVHRPLDCTTVSKWVLKNSSELENTSWILANSKPCPKCHRAIQKNDGCMHMTCSPPCKFEFCWLCLGDWKEHGDKTGGFYACNKYTSDKEKGMYDEEILTRRLARKHAERYTHYYERWVANDKSRQKAVQVLGQTKNKTLAKMSESLCIPVTQLEFILYAWEQIIEARRVLKWTYAYGYYIPDDQPSKQHLFEFLQGDAEANLEKLHQRAEKEVFDFFDEEVVVNDFNPWPENDESIPKKPVELTEEQKLEKLKKFEERTTQYVKFERELKGLTSVTRSHFEQLVRDLEKGLSVVETGAVVDCDSLGSDGEEDDLNESHHWTCSVCTFANPKTSEECEMCNVGELSEAMVIRL